MEAVAARKACISEQDFHVNTFKRPAVAQAKIDDKGAAGAIIVNPVYEAPRDKWQNVIKCSSCSSSLSLSVSRPLVRARNLM